MKALAATALLISLALYIAQVSFYTKDQEIFVYGMFGTLWFLAVYFNAFSAQVTITTIGIVLLSGVAAFGLGFTPHRLRLGPGLDIYVALFPMIHFLATLIFFAARRRVVSKLRD